MLRSLKELQTDFERRRNRSTLRPLEELAKEFASRNGGVRQKALRSLDELTRAFKSRRTAAERPNEAWICEAEVSVASPAQQSSEDASSRAYDRDELLTVFASMRLPARASRSCVRTVPRIGAPPGLEPELETQDEDPKLNDEDRERGADAHNSETFGAAAQAEAEVWALHEQRANELLEECSEIFEDNWWENYDEEKGLHMYDESQEHYYTEDIWDFREKFMGVHDHFWGYEQASFLGEYDFQSYGLADKSYITGFAAKDKTCSSSTAPTESDVGSGGDDTAALQALYW